MIPQHRYLCYAAAHSRTPEAMLEHDREAWPGGHMCGYLIWISREWQAWSREHEKPRTCHTPVDHADFDARLRRMYLEHEVSA